MPASFRVVYEKNFARKLSQWVKVNRIGPCIEAIAERWDENYRSDSIRRRIIASIKESNTWKAIAGEVAGSGPPDLQAVLGIEDPEEVLFELEEFLLNAIEFKVNKGRGGARGIRVGFMSRANQNALLEASFGQYISEPSGETIPWLRWLLEASSDTIGWSVIFLGINDDFLEPDDDDAESYADVANLFAEKSRTGRALMFKIGEWSIDESLSAVGTRTNFLIDALEDDDLRSFVLGKFERAVRNCLRRSASRIARELPFTIED